MAIARRWLISVASMFSAAILTGCSDKGVVDPPAADLPASTSPARIRELPGLGGFWARARGINEFGRIVGEASLTGDHSHAFIWSELGGLRDLGTLGGPSSAAVSINAFSQFVGWANTSDGTTHAFRMTQGDATMQDLGTPANGFASIANDINDAGVVVGVWVTNELRTRAFVWSSDIGMRDLRSVADADDFEAHSVNRSGEMAGVRRDRSGLSHALTWSAEGVPRELDVPEGTTESIASAINSTSYIVGARRTGTGPWLAVLWTPQGVIRDLGVLPMMDWSVALDISDQGHVVGNSGVNGSPGGRAFLWVTSAGMVDLGTLPGSRAESGAFSVNSIGRAVGYSWTGSAYRPVIFRP